MLEVGQVIGGRLRIDRVLGQGGMGIVAAATHLELRQQVAVKMMLPRFATNPTSVERFLREARAVAVLRTEHVCRVFDAGRTDDGAPYIVMEMLDGADLSSVIREQPLSAALAVDHILQTSAALREAHAHGIIHRDLKPANLFVVRGADGRPLVKVLDFGIAKVTDELRLTSSAALLGSPAYMSPEQLHTPRDVDARGDIWSLGITLYQLLTGSTPFASASGNFAEIALMITGEPPRPAPTIDPGLRSIIWRCLEKDRNARFADVDAFAAALMAWRDRARVPAHVRPPRKAGAARSIALASTLVVGGILAGYLARGGSGNTAPTPTVAAAAPVATPPPATAPPEASAPTTPAPAPPPPPSVATSKAVTPKTRPVKAAPPATTTPTSTPAASPPKHRGDAMALATTEATIRQYKNHPDVLPGLYMAAASLACAVADATKARAYFAKLTDAKLREQARTSCRGYSIEL